MTEEIQSICADILQRYKDSLKTHTASGELEKTATYKIKWDGKWFELIFNLQDYWQYLENGTKPHFPPIDAIEKWVKVKHIVPTTTNGRVPSTRQLAYMICRSISLNGTPATKLLQHTIDNSEDLIQKLCDALINEIEKEIDTEL